MRSCVRRVIIVSDGAAGCPESLKKELEDAGIEPEVIRPEECGKVLPERATLWITDSGQTADRLLAEKKYVLGHLHDGSTYDMGRLRYVCEELQDVGAEYIDQVYRRLAGIPWQIAETERCLIRETVPEDAEQLAAIYREPSITRYTDGFGQQAEEQYIREYAEKVYTLFGFGIWTVLDKETLAVIGQAGFCYREGYEEPDMGYMIGVPWQGKGIAAEVCSELLAFGREKLGFERVQALVDHRNEASLALCRKLGFYKAENVQEGKWNCVRMVKEWNADNGGNTK